MKNDSMVDLGVKYGSPEMAKDVPTPKEHVSYPTLYLPSTTKDLPDFPDGDFYFLCKGEVTRCVETKENGKESTSCDISVKSICVCDKNGKPVAVAKSKEESSEDELDKELTKIADKKKK